MTTKNRHRFYIIGSFFLCLLGLTPVAAVPLQPGVQLLTDPQFQACFDQAIQANNWTTTEDVTALNCPNQGIRNLDGISQFVNLNQLLLNGNLLENTSGLEQLNQLSTLDLSDNRLVDINALLNLHNLRKLYLSGNPSLYSLTVASVIQNNTGLTHLGVADIPLHSPAHGWLPPVGPQGEYDFVELDISRTGTNYYDLSYFIQYSNLQILKAAGNQLEWTGPLEQLSHLEILNLSDNHLVSAYGLIGLTGLRQLNLNGNKRMWPDLVYQLIQNNPGLTNLGIADIPMGDYFGNNGLNWLPPVGPQGEYNFVELDISRTGSNIDLSVVGQYANLQVLKAAGNQIQNIGIGQFDQLQQLTVLDLSDNRLLDAYYLNTLTGLRQLNLSGNAGLWPQDVRQVIQNNPALTHLGVADIAMGNAFGSNWLPPVGPQGEYNFVELDISRTGNYHDLNFVNQYSHLQVLKAADNQIGWVGPLDSLLRLEVLDLSNNYLVETYGLFGLTGLRQLNLSGNSRLWSYQVIPLIQNNPGLTHLGVADIAMVDNNFNSNWLPPVGPHGEYNFVELDISRTGNYPDYSLLTQYPHLQVLKAAGNQFERVGSLDPLQRLEVLDLSNNRLADVSGLFYATGLRQLNLSGNNRLRPEDVRLLIQNNPGLTHLGVADIAMVNAFGSNWLPQGGFQGYYNFVELDISRTGNYPDYSLVIQYPKLQALKAAGNQIESIGSLYGLQQLEALDLSGNRISEVWDLFGLTHLRQLNLSGNASLRPEDVHSLIQNNPGLTHLGVADIAMGNLYGSNWLPGRGYNGEYKLVELDMSRTGSYPDLGFLAEYTKLKLLKAAGDHVQFTIPLNLLQQLEVLDLSDNGLADLSGIQGLYQLERLYLNGNTNLQAADVQPVIFNNPGLTHLGVAGIAMGNNLSWLPPMGYWGGYHFVELDISRTGQLNDLNSIEQYQNLKVLKAAGLQLQFVENLTLLPNLETLDLKENALSHVQTLGAIGSLQLLDLRGNSMIPCSELDYLEGTLQGIQFYRPDACIFLNPPTITLLTPVDAQHYFTSDQIHLSANAGDVEDGDISATIAWSSSVDGNIGTGSSLNVSLSAGQHQITAAVSDSHGNAVYQSATVVVDQNSLPNLTILSPQNGAIFNVGDAASLSADATDVEDGNISATIKWSSNIDGEIGIGGQIQASLTAGQHTITATVTDTAGAAISQTVSIVVNALPSLLIQAPDEGTVFQQADMVNLEASASDAEDGDLSAQIAWTSSIDGNLGQGAQISLQLSPGIHTITASVADSAGAGTVKTITVTVNAAPEINLLSPASGGVFMLQENIVLSATAVDQEDGDISSNIQWTSNIDGVLGTGASLSKTLSLGTHILTAKITDAAGSSATVSTLVTVRQINLNVTTGGNSKRKTANLTWSGARTAVDIYMNNAIVATGPASGSLQLTFRNTATFKVCETGTSYCSAAVLAQ